MSSVRVALTSLGLALAPACSREAAPPAGEPPPAQRSEPAGKPREPEVTIEFQDQSASTIAKVIGAVAGRAIEVDPALEANVTLQVRDMPWREALALLAERVGGQVVELEGGRWRIQPRPR